MSILGSRITHLETSAWQTTTMRSSRQVHEAPPYRSGQASHRYPSEVSIHAGIHRLLDLGVPRVVTASRCPGDIATGLASMFLTAILTSNFRPAEEQQAVQPEAGATATSQVAHIRASNNDLILRFISTASRRHLRAAAQPTSTLTAMLNGLCSVARHMEMR
jgi:hypothetical protein